MAILSHATPLVDGGRALRWRESIRLGVVWGLSLLVLPPLLCVMGAVAGVGAWIRRTWSYALHVGLAAAITVLVLSPWAMRNYLALGEAVWFRSNFGIELRLAYNDSAWPDIDRNRFGGAFEQYHPFASAEAAQRLRAEGELAYNRRLLREAVDWMRSEPGQACWLFLSRTVYFWFPRTLRPLQSVFLSALSVLSLAAVWTVSHPLSVSDDLDSASGHRCAAPEDDSFLVAPIRA
jgi:hypothetical protein